MEKTAEILEAEMTILQARLEIMEQEARKEIARLERENKELKKQNEKSARELAEWKARAERAEKFWGERQMDVMDYALKLQMEKDKNSKEQAESFKQFERLLKLIRKRLFGAFDITFTATLDKDKNGHFLKNGIILVFAPEAVISLFCELLGISEERFWENINLGWQMCLRDRIRNNFSVPRQDRFTDLDGYLRADHLCGCKKKKDDETK